MPKFPRAAAAHDVYEPPSDVHDVHPSPHGPGSDPTCTHCHKPGALETRALFQPRQILSAPRAPTPAVICSKCHIGPPVSVGERTYGFAINRPKGKRCADCHAHAPSCYLGTRMRKLSQPGCPLGKSARYVPARPASLDGVYPICPACDRALCEMPCAGPSLRGAPIRTGINRATSASRTPVKAVIPDQHRGHLRPSIRRAPTAMPEVDSSRPTYGVQESTRYIP